MKAYNGYRSINECKVCCALHSNKEINMYLDRMLETAHSANAMIEALTILFYKDKAPNGGIYTKHAIKTYINSFMELHS